LSRRRISVRSLSLFGSAGSPSLGVVNKYLHAAQAAGITWPLPDDLSEAQLRRRMFPPDAAPSPPHYAPVDFLMMAWRCRSDSFLHFSGFNVMGDSSL